MCITILALSFAFTTILPGFANAKENISEGPLTVQQVVNNVPVENNNGIIQEAGKKRHWVKYGKSYNGDNTASKLAVGSIAITISSISKVPASAVWVTNIANLFYQVKKKKVYYHAQTYKDTNSPRMRPAYKVNYKFYSNKAHTKKIGSKSVVHSSN